MYRVLLLFRFFILFKVDFMPRAEPSAGLNS